MGVKTKPVSWSIVRVWPLETASPAAVYTTPPAGTEFTVMVRISEVSASVGAVIPNALEALSSSMVIVALAAATGS